MRDMIFNYRYSVLHVIIALLALRNSGNLLRWRHSRIDIVRMIDDIRMLIHRYDVRGDSVNIFDRVCCECFVCRPVRVDLTLTEHNNTVGEFRSDIEIMTDHEHRYVPLMRQIAQQLHRVQLMIDV